MTKTLFPYQSEAIENTRKLLFERRLQSVAIHLFTGSGKSLVAVNLVKQLFHLDKNRAIFVAPTRELVFQMHSNFKAEWPECQTAVRANNTSYPGLGMVMEKMDESNARLIVASTPTLAKDVLTLSGWDSLTEEQRERIAVLDEKERDVLLASLGQEQWKIDVAPITIEDILTDPEGNVHLHPTSKRSVLVSERFDRILKSGGLPSLVIHDECHHSVSDGVLLLMQRLDQIADVLHQKRPYLVGLTATPIRADQRGLGNLYKAIAISRDFRFGQREGYLAPFAQPISVLPKTQHEETTLAKRLSNWTDFIIETWKEKAENRPTVFYAGKVDSAELGAVDASKALARAFNEAGIPAAHLDGSVCIGPSGEEEPKSQRRKYLKGVMEGKIKVLTNVAVLIEGVDVPPISCVGLLRKLNEVQLTQAIGRAVRKFNGNAFLPAKEDMLLLDYTGDDLTIINAGTLMGFSVDPTTRVFKDIEEEDEEDLLDGKATLDLVQRGDVQGKEAVYRLAKIVSKSSGDWFIDDTTGAMSLSVGPEDIFVITMPQHTMAQNISWLLEEATSALLNGGSDVTNLPKDELGLRQYIEVFEWAKPLYENFTLWHAHKGMRGYYLVDKGYVASHPALDFLETKAITYAYDEVEEQLDTFMGKRSSWKRAEATLKQMQMLQSLMEGNPPENLTKGDAAKLISHLMAFKPVAKYLSIADTALTPFKAEMVL